LLVLALLVGLAAGGAASPSAAGAQVSLVPSNHPVYAWLRRQRVQGTLTFFAYEDMPLSRGRIQEALRALEPWRDRLGRIDRDLLDAYRREFLLEVDRPTRTLLDAGPAIWFEDREPHLFAYVGDAGNAVGDLFGGIGWMSVEDSFLEVEGQEARAGVPFLGGRLYGTLYDHVGFHLESSDAGTIGAPEVLRYDPLWGKSEDVLSQNEGASLDAQAMISVQHGVLSLHLARANARFGSSPDAAVLMSRNPPHYDWVRLNVEFDRFRYTFLHGSLTGPVREDSIPELPGETSRVSIARWFALHRFQVQPWDWLQLGLYEMVTYSNRGVDLAYINPLYPIRGAELDGGDRDNGFLGLDATVRPFPGVELYGELLIDDLDARRLGSAGDKDSQFAVQGGVVVSAPTGTDLYLDYARVDPKVYTHRFRLNAFENREFTVGHPIGPNADQIAVGLRQWLPWRGWVRGRVARVRKGLNVLDEDGNVIFDAGGDVTFSSGPERGEFLAGDLQRWIDLEFEAQLEPTRGIQLRLGYRHRSVREGTRTPDPRILEARLTIGF